MTATATPSVFDTPPDAQDEARRDAQTDAEIEAGKGVPHAKVCAWLLRLAKGEKAPPPAA